MRTPRHVVSDRAVLELALEDAGRLRLRHAVLRDPPADDRELAGLAALVAPHFVRVMLDTELGSLPLTYAEAAALNAALCVLLQDKGK